METWEAVKMELRPEDKGIIRKMKIEYILAEDIQEKRALLLAILHEKNK